MNSQVMNFINDLIKLRTIFFICLILSIKGNPVLSNDFLSHFPVKSSPFVLPQRISANHTADLTFMYNGLMNISTPGAVFIGNGIYWEIIKITGTPALVPFKDNVYIFTSDDAGVISRDGTGTWYYSSFSKIFEKYGVKLSNVTDLKVFEDEVYLINNSELFRLKNDTVIYVDNDFSSGKLFTTGNALILYKSAAGFRKAGIPGSDSSNLYFPFIPDFLFYFPDGYITCSKTDNRFIKLNKDLLITGEWNPGINKNIVFADQSDQFLYFLTTTNDLYIFSLTGKKTPSLFKIIELKDMPVTAIRAYLNKLWLISNGQLSSLEIPSVFLETSFQGSDGMILSATVKNDNIYLGTNTGLFLVSPETGSAVKLFNGICRKIIHSSGNTFFLTGKGLYILDNNGPPREFISGPVMDIILDTESEQIIAGLPGKIITAEINKNTPDIRSEFFLSDITPGNLHAYEEYIYFTGTDSFGRIKLTDPLKNPDFFPCPQHEKIIKVFTCLDKLHLLTEKNIYLLNNDFSLTKIRTSAFPDNYTFFDVSVFHGNSCWLTIRDDAGKFLLFHNTGSYSFSQVTYPLFNSFYPFSVASDSYNRYIISSGKNSFLFTPVNESIPAYHILLTKIITGNTMIYDGIGYSAGLSEIQGKLDNIPYTDNLIQLYLSSTSYTQSDILYRYTLSGKRNLASGWESSPLITLRNLKKGKYSLLIESTDSWQNDSESYNLTFTILTPLWQKWWAFSLYFIIAAILGFILYKQFRIKQTQNIVLVTDAPVSELITKETPKSELFSEEIMPAPSDKSKWEKFETATVLFSDIQGFTKIAEQMNPETLIDELDTFFFHFDSVCEKYDIEKIKTIGDAYMAAGGIPKQNSTNPIEVVLAALEMQNYMKQLKHTRTDIWDLRIGIHSGPVIGGIIGYKKRSYDIWGDTVNTASRMESSGEPGKVNISGMTHKLIKDFFICEYRGKLPVKYKGNIDMYFVKGLRPELSVNLEILPNRIFSLKLQLLRLKDLEEHVFEKLQTELPDNYYFNSFENIRQMYAHASLLSKAENLDIEDDIIIKTSVLLLFSGLTMSYRNYENKSAEYARQILPEYKYTDNQITTIHNLILFAKLQHEPENHFEKIMFDLKTEHFGRSDYIKLYKLQFLEYTENIRNISVQEWKKQQISLLGKHDFYTLSARRLREISSDQQVKNIESDDWQ